MDNLEEFRRYFEFHQEGMKELHKKRLEENMKNRFNEFLMRLKEKYGFSSLIVGGSVLASMLSILGMVVIIKI